MTTSRLWYGSANYAALKSSDNFCLNPFIAQNLADHARRHFHSASALQDSKKYELSRGQMLASLPKEDDGTEGEKIADYSLTERTDIFPDEGLPNRLFDGVRFADLPICNIKASPNNTIMSLTSANGLVHVLHSCGKEGFKNTREGTNIAAQATALTFAMKSLKLGMKTVRVTVRGLGPGRMAAIKGLTMGGMNVVSISDRTPISWVMRQRPKKQRRL
nr:EOG090X0DZ9 [Eurycercus lamellatus]